MQAPTPSPYFVFLATIEPKLNISRVMALPETRKAVAAWLFRDRHLDPRDLTVPRTPHDWLFEIVDLLTTTPVRPRTRAALIDIAASLPGVREEPPGVDLLGNRGVKLVVDPPGWPDEARKGKANRSEIYFDVRTGRVLSIQSVLLDAGRRKVWVRPGSVESIDAFGEAAWVEEPSEPPAPPPFPRSAG